MSLGYHGIAKALKEHEKSYSELVAEIEGFVPLSEEAIEERMLQEVIRMQELNPHQTRDAIVDFVERSKRPCFTLAHQLSERFSDRVDSEHAQIVMLSHSLCEAFANAAIAIGLSAIDAHEFFDLIERANLKEKWLLGPRLFEPTYRFPKDGTLYQTLDLLCKTRNGLTHHKSTVHVDEDRLIKGTQEDRMSYKERSIWIERYLRLPYDLLNHGRSQFPKNPSFFFPNTLP